MDTLPSPVSLAALMSGSDLQGYFHEMKEILIKFISLSARLGIKTDAIPMSFTACYTPQTTKILKRIM